MNRRRALSLILFSVLTAEVVFVLILMSFNNSQHKAIGQASWTLTRQAILSLRRTTATPGRSVRQHIAILGCAVRRRGCRGGRRKSKPKPVQLPIPVLIGSENKRKRTTEHYGTNQRRRFLRRINIQDNDRHVVGRQNIALHQLNKVNVPSLYVLNAAALTKPNAVQQLAVDLTSHESDIAVITETHLKTKHVDTLFHIQGYTLCRRDRQRRRGGGVAIYARSTLQPTIWSYSADDPTYELLWVRVAGVFIGAVYHPPRPQYSTQQFLQYIECCLDELSSLQPAASIVLAGDFNQLSDTEVIGKTGLQQIVRQPTRGSNILDRVFQSTPIYSTIRVVTSLIRSDHKAITAYADQPPTLPKTSFNKTYRPVSPNQHAAFIAYMSSLDLFDSIGVTNQTDIQSDFDDFYALALRLLEYFYPSKTITVSSRDPCYVTQL